MRKTTSKPTSARAARRQNAKANAAPLRGFDDVTRRLPAAVAQTKGPEISRASKAIQAVIQTTAAQGHPWKSALVDLTSGATAFRAGAIDHHAQTERTDGPLADAACQQGCAFCCILSGKDGGLITAYEAETLHTALRPFAGEPDGRDWHPQACPALDPDTQTCRAYQSRPLICRAYFSTSVDACKDTVTGQSRTGTAVLGAYPLYLAVHALARALVGVANAPTFSLAKIAAAAVAGTPLKDAMKSAKHAPSVLSAERDRTDPDLTQ